MAQVHITKLAAADRQLRAAIRMYFAEEDELAIHTVASAAYGLLRDLKAERGQDEAADNVLVSIFYVVRDFRRGTLPEHLASDEAFMAVAREWADQLPIQADSQLSDVRVTIPPEVAKTFWTWRNKITNFLKHADRDASKSIASDEVDNLLLLMQCYSAYQDLTKSERSNEGLIFELYIGANESPIRDPHSKTGEIRAILAERPESERRHMCTAFIKDLNDRQAASAV